MSGMMKSRGEFRRKNWDADYREVISTTLQKFNVKSLDPFFVIPQTRLLLFGEASPNSPSPNGSPKNYENSTLVHQEPFCLEAPTYEKSKFV
jgi:hypothetical protein